MVDEFDRIILDVVYTSIDASATKRTTGSDVWNEVHGFTSLAPVVIPARLRKLVSLGLLAKDKGNSSSKYKVYAPTDAGYKEWHETKSQPVPEGS